MDKLDSLVNKSKLPNQLKEYFTTSDIIKKVVTKEVINEIEELFIFYNALYTFDTSKFSAYTITSLKECKDVDLFYSYLKNVVDTNLELKSRDNVFNNVNEKKILENDVVNRTFKEVAVNFIRFVNLIYNKEKVDIDMDQLFKHIGKLEVINQLIDDNFYRKLLHDAKLIIHRFNKING